MELISLVEKAKKGDDTAFYQLVSGQKEQLYRIAMSYLKREEAALEAIQETTFRSYKAIKKLKNPEYFSTWLIRILINYCKDELKKQKRVIHHDDLAVIAGAKEEAFPFEIEEAVYKLDEKFRDVIILKFFHDMKISDIATLLKCPESTVKTWLYKGLKALKHQLEEEGGQKHV
ncbi:sigma-70 family RNA polymerase sigma factor [Bacillus sp. FJAT-49736]|uniref:sigma-70 family RNA polymerase sigma factor n=1 Tax=Bacillus sp. FJAT-49736 TaxID=2833582 RepID=UPI001BC9B86D|nr:sigma-70 family RNA polymerase sigma factor [Bacillus sp. FJAT-49736]MBS4173380.1 sigma-70 family RNA polymerase sigma factor [Bacillus sp. FJAT-49736]